MFHLETLKYSLKVSVLLCDIYSFVIHFNSKSTRWITWAVITLQSQWNIKPDLVTRFLGKEAAVTHTCQTCCARCVTRKDNAALEETLNISDTSLSLSSIRKRAFIHSVESFILWFKAPTDPRQHYCVCSRKKDRVPLQHGVAYESCSDSPK